MARLSLRRVVVGAVSLALVLGLCMHYYEVIFPSTQSLHDAIKRSANDTQLTHEELVRHARANAFPHIDKEHLNGRIGFHEDGSPGWTPLEPIVNETFEQKQLHHTGNCFNLRRSDSLALDR